MVSDSPPLAVPIPDSLLHRVYNSDQDIYPTPFAFSTLQSWVSSAPDLSFAYVSQHDPLGVLIALPLELSSWTALVDGQLREPDIKADMFALQTRESREIGLHIFHIERFDAWQRNFGSFAQYAIGEARQRLERGNFVVKGMSALVVTDNGRKAFEKLGLQSTGYLEIFVKHGDETVMQIYHNGQVQRTDDVVGKAEMLAATY